MTDIKQETGKAGLEIGSRVRWCGPTERNTFRFTPYEHEERLGTITAMTADESFISYGGETDQQRAERLKRYADTHVMVKWDRCTWAWSHLATDIELV